MGNMWVILHHSAVIENAQLAEAEIEPGTTGSKWPHARHLATVSINLQYFFISSSGIMQEIMNFLQNYL